MSCPTCGSFGQYAKARRGGRVRIRPGSQASRGARLVPRPDHGVRAYWKRTVSGRYHVCPDPFHDRLRSERPKPEPAPIPMHRLDPDLEAIRSRRHAFNQRKEKR